MKSMIFAVTKLLMKVQTDMHGMAAAVGSASCSLNRDTHRRSDSFARKFYLQEFFKGFSMMFRIFVRFVGQIIIHN